MSILILGDVHLGGSLSLGKTGIGTALNSRIVDQINLLDWTLEQAYEHNVSHLIITGDVFEDPKPHPSIITQFISWVKRCEAQGISLHIIAGNHDILRSGNFVTSPLDIISECEIENIFVYKDLSTIFIDSTAITFMPFRDRKSFLVNSNQEALSLLQNSLQYELASIPSIYNKIIIGHFALEGSIPGDEIDDLTNELFCPLNMFEGYDYVWMGHIHKPQVMKKSPYIAHIGSMDLSNYGETDHQKKIVIFDQSFQEIDIPTRPLKKVSISIPKDTFDTTQFVLDEIEKHSLNKSVVKLEVNLSSPELLSIDRNKIEKSLYEKGVFHISGLSESKKISLIKKNNNSMDTSMDVSSAIKNWADQKYKEEDKKQKFMETTSLIMNKLKNETS